MSAQEGGRSPADAGSGHSAEPEPVPVSALRASVPNAGDIELIGLDRNELLTALYDAKLQLIYLDSRWPTGTTPAVIARIDHALSSALPWNVIAQAIETRRAETEGLGAKHESAVGEADAPEGSSS